MEIIIYMILIRNSLQPVTHTRTHIRYNYQHRGVGNRYMMLNFDPFPSLDRYRRFTFHYSPLLYFSICLSFELKVNIICIRHMCVHSRRCRLVAGVSKNAVLARIGTTAVTGYVRRSFPRGNKSETTP